MRLARTTEWALVAAVAISTAFLPGSRVVREVLKSRVGLALGLGLVYWIACTVSTPLALAVFLAVARSSSAALREHMNADCGCPDPTYTYDSGTKRCTSGTSGTGATGGTGASNTISPVCCGIGEIWDGIQSKCTPSPRSEGGAMTIPETTSVTPKISSVNNARTAE